MFLQSIARRTVSNLLHWPSTASAFAGTSSSSSSGCGSDSLIFRFGAVPLLPNGEILLERDVPPKKKNGTHFSFSLKRTDEKCDATTTSREDYSRCVSPTEDDDAAAAHFTSVRP